MLIITGFVLLGASAFLHFVYRRHGLSLTLLAVSSFMVACAYAMLDPFLNLWDEQFHALVAKNMMTHPFVPMLYSKDVLMQEGADWTAARIWLHKQPLFLWQMALSMKLFGVSVFSMRLPGVLMHAGLTVFTYRIGKIAAGENVAFAAAAFFTMAHFPLELVAGLYHTDHNDTAFLFYVTASIWGWFEYQRNPRRRWWIIIGLFAGGAVLVKWLAGLLVFAAWAIAIAATGKWREGIDLCKSAGLAGAVFAPWQLYILWSFPSEAVYEYQLSARHFTEVVEGHGGGWLFYWNGLEKLYGPGDALPWIIAAGFVFLLNGLKETRYKWFIGTAVLLVYGFFTLAATKMYAFTLIVAPLLFLALAYLLDRPWQYALTRLANRRWLYVLQAAITVFVSFALLDVGRTLRQHSMNDQAHNNKREQNMEELAFIESIDLPAPDGQYVIFNTNITDFGAIPFMFHRDFAAAYPFLPDKQMVEMTLAKGYIPLVVEMEERGSGSKNPKLRMPRPGPEQGFGKQ